MRLTAVPILYGLVEPCGEIAIEIITPHPPILLPISVFQENENFLGLTAPISFFQETVGVKYVCRLGPAQGRRKEHTDLNNL